MANLQPRMPSRSRSRPGLSRRGTSRSSMPYLPGGAEDLLIPEGPVGEEVAELLQDFVHPHHHAEHTLVEEEEEAAEDNDPSDEVHVLAAQALEERARMPWWKRPSPYWFLVLMPLSSIAMAATIAPRIEIYTMLACDAYRPEYTAGRGTEGLGIHPPWWRKDSDDGILIGDVPATAKAFVSVDHSGQDREQSFSISTNSTVPPSPQLCRSDPVVQAAVAKLTTTMSTAQGVLAILTTAWWGSLSDRRGRTRVIGVTIFGVLLMDFNFIFVTMYTQRLPGGYWMLLLGPLLDGCLGGMNTASAAFHAYVADCSGPAERTRFFSLNMGLLFIGLAMGPTLGGLLIHHTGNIMSVFYLAACVHFLYALINWFILPESLSRAQRAAALKKYRIAVASRREQLATLGWGARIRSALAIFAPLEIFLPVQKEGANPLKGGRRDWNLTYVVAAQAWTILVVGSYTYKFQYAQGKFNWTSENLSYLITAVGLTRAIHLVVILPLLLRIFKPKVQPIQLPVESQEPLGPETDAGEASSSTPPSGTSATASLSKGKDQRVGAGRRSKPHSIVVELWVARVSLFVEIIAYTIMALAPNGTVFLLSSMGASLGGGFGPAVSTIAVELFAARGGTESGKLFGALALVQALTSHVIGPFSFGILYMKTVKTYPVTIFYISVAVVTISFILLCLVRLPEPVVDTEELQGVHPQREETLVDADSSADRADRADRK